MLDWKKLIDALQIAAAATTLIDLLSYVFLPEQVSPWLSLFKTQFGRPAGRLLLGMTPLVVLVPLSIFLVARARKRRSRRDSKTVPAIALVLALVSPFLIWAGDIRNSEPLIASVGITVTWCVTRLLTK